MKTVFVSLILKQRYLNVLKEICTICVILRINGIQAYLKSIITLSTERQKLMLSYSQTM